MLVSTRGHDCIEDDENRKDKPMKEIHHECGFISGEGSTKDNNPYALVPLDQTHRSRTIAGLYPGGFSEI
jgi:hypothetical protein